MVRAAVVEREVEFNSANSVYVHNMDCVRISFCDLHKKIFDFCFNSFFFFFVHLLFSVYFLHCFEIY